MLIKAKVKMARKGNKELASKPVQGQLNIMEIKFT
jgi:hypothetical protein